MENNRIIKILKYLSIGGAIFATPIFVFAYNEKTTHPALTQEIVKFYNYSFPKNELGDEEKGVIMQGSIDEDAGIRSMQHFYDPVYNKGLVLGIEWQSSKNWGQSVLAQAKFDPVYESKSIGGLLAPLFGASTDFTWERAIYEYAWGDKKRGLESLGHILHLVEDATVPDHTRNDPHPPILGMGSPYESWTSKINSMNIKIADELVGKHPNILPTLSDYFDADAKYSNNNFFSKGTVLTKKYASPQIVKTGIEYINGKPIQFGYSLDESGKQYKLIEIEEIFGDKSVQNSIDNNYVLSDYWSLLSKQAVLNGAGVIKLFFAEVAKEKQTKTLYNQNRSWLGKEIDKFKSDAFSIAGILYGTSVKQADLENDAFVTQSSPLPNTNTISQPTVNTPTPEIIQAFQIQTPAAENNQPQTPNPIVEKSKVILSDTSSFVPIAGGGGGESPPPSENSEDKTPPAPPVITSPSQNNQTATTTSITFSGTSEAGATISNNFSAATTTASVTNNWSLVINSLPEGTTTVNFFATDRAGNKSNSSSRTIFVDSLGPSTSLVINECNQSLSADNCLIATTTINISWSSPTLDLDHYIIECETNGTACSGFSLSNTTATSTSYTLPTDNSIYTFRAKAVDTNGNIGAEETKTVEVVTRPVVINEIAWAGTSATRSFDEWLELFNNTDKNINLANWVLRSTDNTPYIKLSGSIPANGFSLLERTDDHTISDISANQIYTGALDNSGEVLELSYASSTLDKTPEIGVCNGWCAGSASNYYTMERYDPTSSGENSSNWGSFGGLLPNGKNADNLAISGTPGKRNSINYLIANGNGLAQNKTLRKAQSPYVILSEFTINNGATLTVEPGAIVKFYNGASALTVNGTLKAEGTAENPIVFTSFKDDSYGGDTNQDAAASVPQAGGWGTIKILGNNSSFDHAVIKYGGVRDPLGNFWANLRAENASSFSLKNSTVENSAGYGARLVNVSGTLEENIIRNNNQDNQSVGISVRNGDLTIRNNTFTNNYTGLLLNSSEIPHTMNVTQNTFTGNSGYPIQVNDALPYFSGNIASGNATNGISLAQATLWDYTLNADLPYVIQNTTYYVLAGKTLTLSPGVVIKLQGSSSFSVAGKLLANGTDSAKIIFTSLNDDEYGGDTNNAITSPAAGDWLNLTFASGSSSSTLNNTVVRYGGTRFPLDPNTGAIRISDSSIDIQNSTVEKNYLIGIWMKNSTSTSITSSLIQNHQSPDSQSYGIYLTNSSNPLIQNTAFKNNKTAIWADGSSAVQNKGGITFENNTVNTVPADLIH